MNDSFDRQKWHFECCHTDTFETYLRENNCDFWKIVPFNHNKTGIVNKKIAVAIKYMKKACIYKILPKTIRNSNKQI